MLQVKNWFAFLLALLVAVIAGYIFYFQSATADRSTATVEENKYRFFKTACWFDADWTATITCGELHTPHNDGRFILPVVILHSDAEQVRADPVVYLQGGPGAGARLHNDGIKQWLSWMRFAQLQRDLILLDTRGTGRSKPALVCSEYNQFNQQLLKKNTSLRDELSQGFDVASTCFAKAVNIDPALDHRNFSTQKSAQDVRALMVELGYPEWNILGVSYGTRLALEVAHQEQQYHHSVKLKSMVLDSVYPAGFGGVQTWPQMLDDGLKHFFNGCSMQQNCVEQLGSHEPIEQQFLSVLSQLQIEPLTLTVPRWDGEAPVTFVVNDHRFVSATFAAVYNPADWQKIIDAIHAVRERRTSLLKPLIEPYVNQSMSSDFNSLTFTAVDCADNPVQAEANFIAELTRYPLLQNYTRDQWRYQLCHKLQSESSLRAVEPKVPTLMLAGALDPVTPVGWAQAVQQQWPQTQLRVRQQVAHAVLASDVCLLENLDRFFDQPQEKFTACPEGDELSGDVKPQQKVTTIEQ
ncbi:alpha/beta fold hydrolase [Cellvibrio sp. UBA7661]|uniref:alpha/beta fold hydrolase n=1 Tax=Cellvibrio sp. UBA7661 TaxID=1946311 RepID=UPI002F3517A6